MPSFTSDPLIGHVIIVSPIINPLAFIHKIQKLNENKTTTCSTGKGTQKERGSEINNGMSDTNLIGNLSWPAIIPPIFYIPSVTLKHYL